MATDIVDKDLKALRNARWEKAFKKSDAGNGIAPEEHVRDTVNRKATIVIEHIIQASDISHTMQHWHVYRVSESDGCGFYAFNPFANHPFSQSQKWNQNLFEELYVANLNGRMDKSPEEFWYKGEFGTC